MTKAKLERMLREAGIIARETDFFLFGSQSLRPICPRYPKDFPKTLEADLYPRHHPQAWRLLIEKMGRDSAFYHKHGVFLDCVDPGLSTLPDKWIERLIPFRTPRTGGVTAWCLEANDLFACKLAAWRVKDQEFLQVMLKRKLARPEIVLSRIEDLPIAPPRRSELAQLLRRLSEDVGARQRTRPKKK